MKAFVRKISIGLGRAHGSWLALLLLLVVLVPSATLLWFMDQAMRNERLAVRQKLADAYRGHLSLAQEHLEQSWNHSIDDLEMEWEKVSPAALFGRAVGGALADAVICLDGTGKAAYPDALKAPAHVESSAEWRQAQYLESRDMRAAARAYGLLADTATNADMAARAWQAEARCLVGTGKKAEAIAVLTGPLAEERSRGSRDPEGRFLAPNAKLMALELLKGSDPARARELFDQLQRELNDYNNVVMPAPQRRFLMRELQRLYPGEAAFPTLAAEEFAARCLEAGAIDDHALGLRPGLLAGVWQFTSGRRRVVLLSRTESLRERLKGLSASAAGWPADVRMDVIPPGQETEGALASMPAGKSFPGWRLEVSLADARSFDAASRQRVSAYLWIGMLAVGTIVVLALLALGLVRRQAALAQLRNDLVANVTHELKTPLSSMRLFVETLLNAPQLHEPTVREYLQLVARENLRLSRLIDNFLTFSRIERNRYTFDFKEIPAKTIVDGAAAAVRERFASPGCRFQVLAGSDLPQVTADADAMVSALINLLDNAYKYSGDTKEITLVAAAENGTVRFTVTDNGIGLSARESKRIFRRFYQVDQNFRGGGGCGLGLSIVQFVVTAHHGTVRVESEVGRGSAFTVTLPAAQNREGTTS